MNPDHHLSQWSEFERRARHLLESGAVEPLRLARRVRLLVLPSFEDCVSYQLLEARRPQGFHATKTSWRREIDYPKFDNPLEWVKHRGATQPTFEAVRAGVDSATATSLLASLQAIAVPFRRSAVHGCDGTSYRLDFGDSFASMTLRWWSSGPREWAPLLAWADEFVKSLENLGPWEPCHAADAREFVSVGVEWSDDRPCASELAAIRRLVPSLASEPLQELRARAATKIFDLGRWRWTDAIALQRAGAANGLVIRYWVLNE